MQNMSLAKWLYVVAFLDIFAVSLVIPLLSAHIHSLGASYFVSGLISSLYAGLQLFSGPVIGSWSDLRGRKSILLITTLICSMSYIFLGIATTISLVLVARIILGLMKHTQTLSRALVSDMVPGPLQAEVYGTITAISGAGFIVGPVIGGHLGELTNGFRYICFLVALLFWINSAIVYTFLPDHRPRQKDSTSDQSVGRGLLRAVEGLTLIDWPRYWDIFTLKFTLGFVLAIFFSEYSVSIQDKFQLTPKWVGYTISFQGLVGSTSGLSIGFLDKIYQNNVNRNLQVFHGFLLLCGSLLCLSVAPNLFTFMSCLIPMSASSSLLRIMSTEIMLERTSTSQKGTLIGTSNSISSVSRLVAPVCAGLVRDSFSTVGISVLTVVVALIGTSLAGVILKRNMTYEANVLRHDKEL